MSRSKEIMCCVGFRHIHGLLSGSSGFGPLWKSAREGVCVLSHSLSILLCVHSSVTCNFETVLLFPRSCVRQACKDNDHSQRLSDFTFNFISFPFFLTLNVKDCLMCRGEVTVIQLVGNVGQGRLI